MPTKASLTEDMKQAMRDKNSEKLGVIRFLLSEIKNAEIDKPDRAELTEDEVIKVIARQMKQLKEGIEELKKSDRAELVTDEEAKLAILESYMPAQLSEAELNTIIDEELAKSEDKNMGKLIGAVKARVGNQADGQTVARLVKEKMA